MENKVYMISCCLESEGKGRSSSVIEDRGGDKIEKLDLQKWKESEDLLLPYLVPCLRSLLVPRQHLLELGA